MARRSKKNPAADLWDVSEVAEVPRVGEASNPSKRPTNKRLMRWYVVSACFLMPLSAITALTGWQQASAAAKNQASVVSYSPSKAIAMKAVQDWLKGTPSPVPGGTLQSWDSSHVLKDTSGNQPDANAPVLTYEVHNLTIVSATGRIYDTTVQTVTGSANGTQIIGQPTLIPRAPDANVTNSNAPLWPGADSAPISSSVRDAANVWAKAFTGGDPSALRQSVGDPDSTHAYVPLSGVQHIDNIQVVAATNKPADGEKPVKGQSASRIIARVSFNVLWVGQTLADGQKASTLTFDVIIDKANTGSPVIVAWGGPGTGPDTNPYANAVVGRSITSDGTSAKDLNKVNPTTSPTSTPEPGTASASSRPVPTAPTVRASPSTNATEESTK